MSAPEPEISTSAEEVDQPFTEAELMAEAEREFAATPLRQPGTNSDAPVDPTTAAMLRIAQSMEQMMSRQEAVRQIPFNEIKPVTPWNPEGKRNRPDFARTTYMHGIMLNPMTHTEKTIALFNQLKPGRYLDRKVEVQKGNDGSINIQWAGKKIDQRLELYSQFNHIDQMLDAIIAERKAKEEKKRRGHTEDDEEV